MWQLDSKDDIMSEMLTKGFNRLAVGRGALLENGQSAGTVLAFYNDLTGVVGTFQYLVGQFGSKRYKGEEGVYAEFLDPDKFDMYADGMGIKMCPITRLAGFQ